MSARERTIADQTVTLSDMAAESTYNGVTRRSSRCKHSAGEDGEYRRRDDAHRRGCQSKTANQSAEPTVKIASNKRAGIE